MGGQDRHPGHGCAVTLTPPWAGPIRCNPFYRNFGAWGIRSRPGTASIFPSIHRRGRQYPAGQPGGRLYRGGPESPAGGHPHRPAAARTDAPGVPVAVPRPEIPCPGRLPAPHPPEITWVSSPVLQIPVSPPLLPEGPSADTDGLFHAPGTYQTGPLSTAVSLSPPKPY